MFDYAGPHDLPLKIESFRQWKNQNAFLPSAPIKPMGPKTNAKHYHIRGNCLNAKIEGSRTTGSSSIMLRPVVVIVPRHALRRRIGTPVKKWARRTNRFISRQGDFVLGQI